MQYPPPLPGSTPAMSDPIPRFSSADLHIAAWERLDHGGHSFVFKVSIDDTLSVIKIVPPPSFLPSPTPF